MPGPLKSPSGQRARPRRRNEIPAALLIQRKSASDFLRSSGIKMRTRVKICGVTSLEDALAAVELGAAAIGFNFYPPSPRYIHPAPAAEIIRQLPPSVTPVGVYADEGEAEKVLEVARRSGVRMLQLHGPRIPPAKSLTNYPVIRAFPVGPGFDLHQLSRYNAYAFLLDGFAENKLGGTGQTFDWSVARDARRYGHIFLAGGLTPENVSEAIRMARPFRVDVASGVEASLGRKDRKKMEAFFATVNAAAADEE